MSYALLNSLASWFEGRFGKRSAGLGISLVLMVIAGLYVRPAVKTVALGVHYGRMAEDPFAFIPGIAVVFRILTPLISYLLGFRGQLIIITNLLMAAALLVLVYHYFRSRTPQPGDALYAAGVMAFSLVTLTTVYYGGYCDSLTYLIVFLMWWLRSNRPVFYLLFFLGMLNRECLLFLIPWFAYLHLCECRCKWRGLLELVIGLGIALGLYYVYRSWIGSHGEVPFRARYYLEPLLEDPLHWIRYSYVYWGTGFFSVFKLLWCLPLVAGVSMWRNVLRRELFSMVLVSACAISQLVIAYDTSRMLTLSFPVVLVALLHLFKTNAFGFRGWAGYVLVGNFLVPQLYTASRYVEVMYSTPGNIIMLLLFRKDGW